MSETGFSITREQLIETLKTHKCTVEFTKVNGEKRTMPCTLNPAFMPAQPVVEGKVARKTNDNVISVWCLDKAAWRSFRMDSVTGVFLDLGQPVVA